MNKDQLKVENIFVRNFNQDVYFKPKDPINFSRNLMARLEEDKMIICEGETDDDCLEMLRAIKNLISYQNVLTTPGFDTDRLVTLLCQLSQQISKR